MHIFIDESGTFTPASATRAVSVVAALTIPDDRLAEIGNRYTVLRPSLLKKSDEVKGRDLSEAEVASVVSMLASEEVLFEATAVDMSIHGAADVAAHKSAQATAMVKHLTDQHAPAIHAGVARLRERLEGMTAQLYVQSVVTFALIERVIQHGTLYYCQRLPRELGAFN